MRFINLFSQLKNTFIIQGFLFYSYISDIVRTYWKKYFITSTKLILPVHTAYYTVCWQPFPISDNASLGCTFYQTLGCTFYQTLGCTFYQSVLDIDVIEPLLKPIYLYHNTNKQMILCKMDATHDFRVKPSTAKFINVLYINGDKEPLTLHLNHNYLYEGNEILCSTHVLYLLQTQYEKSEFTFNLNYQLKIMDGHFTINVLNAKQFVYLTASDKGFIVKDIDKYLPLIQ